MKIRDATEFDANLGSEVLRRSIIELCGEDHGFNPEIICAWIANKTPECWLNWICQSSTALYVAEDNGQIVGVSMMNNDGEILLNYVSPEARFKGYSKAMLEHMEENARAMGMKWCSLTSTETARSFYSSAGYEHITDDSRDGLRMRKRLARADS